MSKIKLAVFDWAGTAVDYGCVAPLEVFKKVFEDQGIHLTLDEVSKPMGMGKKDHIRTLLQSENATNQWRTVYQKDWTEDDVERMFQTFQKDLLAALHQYCTPIDGVLETMELLKNEGLHIGSTTGYTREMMDIVEVGAKKLGYAPEFLVTSEVVGSGRPAPFMIFENMRHFNVFPPKCVIKVGDTASDIHEANNAGVWSIGIIEGSSASQMTPVMNATLTLEEKQPYFEKARKVFEEAGADYIIQTIRDLPNVIKEINERI